MIATSYQVGVTLPITSRAMSVEANKQVNGIDALATLTSADKKMLVAATGSLDLINNREARLLATRIALDRYMGNLTGEIDKSYVIHLLNEQRDQMSAAEQQGSGGVSLRTLDKVLTFLYLEHPTVGVHVDTRV